MITSRAVGGAVIVSVFLAVAACSDNPGLSERPSDEPPAENTPAADATSDIDDALAEYYTQNIEWERCGGDFDCAEITVPLDYDSPDDDTVELAILRAPATGDGEPQGSLLVNPGGPGASGVEYARSVQSVVSPEVHERYDIVGFDPRGVGRSKPIECLDDAGLDEFTASDLSPDDEAEIEGFQENVTMLADGCTEQSGDMMPHLGTDNVARDLDILRSALGDEELAYLGKSYGTVIGAHYAELFPERVGRMVLDGAMDPALTIDEMALGQAEGFESAFNAFTTWCVEQETCALGGTPDETRQAMADLLASVDEEPLPTDQEDRPLTEGLAFYGVAAPLYYPPEQGYPMLDAALTPAIQDGDGSALLELSDLYLGRTSDGDYRSNMNEAAMAVNCQDRGSDDVTVPEAQAAVSEFTSVAPTFGENLAWSGLGCASWPHVPDEPPEPVSASGAAPIVVVGTTGDPATPYAWAEAMVEQLESGVLLTAEGFLHTAYLRAGNPCVDDAVDAYLIDGTVPDDGTVCT